MDRLIELLPQLLHATYETLYITSLGLVFGGLAGLVLGLALGAQAGEARLRDVVTAAGFTRMTRVAETPFNLVLEARP